MPRSVALLLVLTLVVAACDRDSDAQKTREFTGRMLKGVLAYPQSSVVSISAGEEAAEIVLSTPIPVSDVAAWYRQALALNGWELRSDIVQRDGSEAIYAQKGAQPLWITLRANVGGPGTTYTLVGAVSEPDSGKKAAGGR
jgi:hypothetical protein